MPATGRLRLRSDKQDGPRDAADERYETGAGTSDGTSDGTSGGTSGGARGGAADPVGVAAAVLARHGVTGPAAAAMAVALTDAWMDWLEGIRPAGIPHADANTSSEANRLTGPLLGDGDGRATLAVRLDAAAALRLAETALLLGRSVSSAAAELIEDHVEDAYRAACRRNNRPAGRPWE